MNVEGLQRRVEGWIKDQTSKLSKLQLPPLPQLRWVPAKWPPWSSDRDHRKKLQEEYERRRKQLQDLCHVFKAESVPDLQDILCCMVLSECVYKRPTTELIRSVNKFKADFGGQLICLERVQPSLDHVPHRYLLAEAGDTLFASFIGTKEYKDVVADANILQGALFHEDDMELMEDREIAISDIANGRKGNVESLAKSLETKSKQLKNKLRPAAHRGFMARAKGIPAVELYRLAQKKKRKLVLCGHSLGGAVAALATLAILRVIAVSSPLKDNEKFQVKCITFSQPPVGNAALRDYVDHKGWHHYFKTYCIPEDLIPRLLSPAYFDHYNNAQTPSADGGAASSSVGNQGDIEVKVGSEKLRESQGEKPKKNEGEQLVFGVGPVQAPFWRLSRLVPIEGIRKHLPFQRRSEAKAKAPFVSGSDSVPSSLTDNLSAPQSLEIEEGCDSVSLKPISESDVKMSASDAVRKVSEKTSNNGGDVRAWRRIPSLPSYVPFGELYLLGTSSVESLSDAEYSKLTSVISVISELKERFQSHSMRSYRSRFQRIYDQCTSDSPASFLGIEQLQQFPHLHQWLGLSIAGTVELGHIVESPSIRTATSMVPLGWTGTPGEKNADPLKVDILGSGLHLCSRVLAQVNGNWCCTTVETLPLAPTYSDEQQPELHKMRVLIGAPLRNPPKHQIVPDALTVFPSIDSESINLKAQQMLGALSKSKFPQPPGLNTLVIYCTTDFTTISKEVDVRTRRVKFVGLEGAGKTSLLKAISNKGRLPTPTESESLLPEADIQEIIAGGLCFMDSAGVNLQELSAEAFRLRDELWMGIRDLSKKIDLLVLVHNLSHQIPRYNDSNLSQRGPALSLLLDEAKTLGIPWVLAITNKFSVSAHQQRAAIDAALKAYQASPSNTEILNACPYVIHTAGNSYASLSSAVAREETNRGMFPQGIGLGPLNFVRRPFQRKATILPIEGVDSFCQLVHRELRSKEESSFEEFARDRLLLQLAEDRAKGTSGRKDAQDKVNSLSAATIGASLGAGIGVVLAVVMGAASALRKP